MSVLSWGRNPWGQDVLTRVSWDLLYLVAAAAVLFVVVHAVYVRLRPKTAMADAGEAPPQLAIPDRVVRHTAAARAFHWVMAASMIALLVTGFLPIVGVQFDWVALHWIAGLVLTASIAYHVVDAWRSPDFQAIWIDRGDVAEWRNRLRRATGGEAPAPRRAGKYPADNKLFHLAILLSGVAAIVTGLLMLKRIPTPFLVRNPYLLGDQTWGFVYVLHGLSGIGLVGLTLSHVYIAIRPEKRSLTRSMVFGWISRSSYLEHHDPNRWAPGRGPR